MIKNTMPPPKGGWADEKSEKFAQNPGLKTPNYFGSGPSKILVCGPPPMMQAVCGDKDYSGSTPQQGELKGMLKELGYTADQVFKY